MIKNIILIFILLGVFCGCGNQSDAIVHFKTTYPDCDIYAIDYDEFILLDKNLNGKYINVNYFWDISVYDENINLVKIDVDSEGLIGD